MELGLLGPVEILGTGGPVAVRATKERALLAVLAVNANERVGVDLLIEALWGQSPPTSSLVTLRAYLSRLRRALGAGGVTIETIAGGYRLAVPPGCLDVSRVETMAAEAGEASRSGDPARAAELLAGALALWRGEPLGEFAGEMWAAPAVGRLNELRTVLLEERVEAELACGRHAAMAAELEALCAEHPLRERLWGQRIVALYRSGRQAEALRVYQELRRMLGEELGIEPSPDLRALEQAVLSHDAALEWHGPATLTAGEAPDGARLADATGSPSGADESGGDRLGPLPFPASLELSDTGRFVGRAGELAQLRASWECALEGSCRTVLVAGEPGIGKSRLVGEFARSLHDQGAAVLFGVCDEDPGLPYQPFAEAMRRVVAASPPALLESHVARAGADLVRLVPELSLRLPALPAPIHSEPDSERYRLFEAVVDLLHSAARHQPVLLVLDDLQWATKPTLLLLRHLLRSFDQAPLLIVALYRDTEPSDDLAESLAELRRVPGVERVRLGGLDEEGVLALLQDASETPLDDDGRSFARRLHSETGGSPFFVGEVVRHLAETAGGKLPASSLASGRIELPASVREVIGRRLARLSEPARTALSAAAVMGPTFSAAVVEKLEGDGGDETVLDALDEAVAAGMIRESPARPGEYVFAHSLVRQALYDRLGVLRRVRLHRRVAEALESFSDAESRLSELAVHYLAAAADGVADKAVEYAARAARRATERVAYEEAVRLYEQALEVLNWEGTADTRRAGGLIVGLADCHWKSGDAIVSRETYAQVVELARRIGDPELLAVAVLRNDADTGGYGHAVDVDYEQVARLEEALAAIDPGDSPLRARLLGRLAVELFYTDEADRRDQLTTGAVEMAERLGDPAVLLSALNSREWATSGNFVDPDRRLASAGSLLRLAEELGDLEIAYQARFLRVMVLIEKGDFRSADLEADEGERLAAELRVPGFLPWVPAYRALRAWIAGRLAEADSLSQRALADALGTRSNPEVVFALIGGQALFFSFLRAHFADAISVAEQLVVEHPENRSILAAVGWGYGLLGRNDECSAAFKELAREGFADVPADAGWLITMGILSAMATLMGDQDASRILYGMLEPFAGRWTSAVLVLVGPVSDFLGRLAAVAGRYDDAERHLRRALEETSAIPAPLFEALTRYHLASMLADRDGPGDRGEAAGLLRQCLATAEELELVHLAGWARLLADRLGDAGGPISAGAAPRRTRRARGPEDPRPARGRRRPPSR